VVSMRKLRFLVVLAVISVLVSSVSAVTQTGVMGVWRDINPTAYITPPANPPINSIYMLSPNEGWAVGNSTPTTDIDYAFPPILHYDGSTWNLVPAPKSPTELPILPTPASYALTSVSFGPPGNPIGRNDGWAVGYFEFGTPAAVALHWDGVTWRPQLAGIPVTPTSTPDAGRLLSVSMVSSTDVWAVGQNAAETAGVFWHWTGVPGLGGGWNEPQAPVTSVTAFRSVFMVSASEGWAVGTMLSGAPAGSSNIYHYYGGSWTAFPSPDILHTLRSVFMISPTDGWAVGDSGIILHYTSGTWTGPVSPGTTLNDLLSVFMVSSLEGWAFGTQGSILHYSGGTWTALPVNLVPTNPASGPYSFAFRSAYLNSATDGWAVGDRGVILHWDGVNWGTVTSPTINSLNSISFGPPLAPISPDDGWAVGNSTPPINPLTWIGPSSAYATEPTVIHWNGFVWTKGVSIGTTNNLFSVFMLTSGDVWTVGGGGNTTATCTAAPCPTILHYTGGSWNTVTPPPGSYVLKSVFMVSPDEGWAVGWGSCATCAGGSTALNTGIILHYTNTGGVGSWAVFPAPTTPTVIPRLSSVFMLGPNEGWAVGDAMSNGGPLVLHYTVTGGVGTWNVVTVGGLTLTPAVSANLNSVFMLSPTSGWAAGGYNTPNSGAAIGPIIVYWDGSKWTPVSTPTIPGGPVANPPVLKSVYFTGPNDGWAVGGVVAHQIVSTIFHWDGIAWNHITLSPSLLGIGDSVLPPTLNSVYMLSPSSGWIVGRSPDFPTDSLTCSGSGGASGTCPNLASLPLSTILRFAAFGGLTTVTATSTLTVSTSTTALTATTATTITSGITVPSPNITVNIKVVDNQGNPVPGANVTIASLGLLGVTNSSGIVTFTLPPGSYTVTSTKAGKSVSQTIAAATDGQTFTTPPLGGMNIPGFPAESIVAGAIGGILALVVLRRRRK